jgi:hypothetical protein
MSQNVLCIISKVNILGVYHIEYQTDTQSGIERIILNLQ